MVGRYVLPSLGSMNASFLFSFSTCLRTLSSRHYCYLLREHRFIVILMQAKRQHDSADDCYVPAQHLNKQTNKQASK